VDVTKLLLIAAVVVLFMYFMNAKNSPVGYSNIILGDELRTP
jgi:hypothetical protein